MRIGMTKDTELTISVPEAGRRYFGLSRNASYTAASRGEIPAIRIGRLLRVPVRALEKMLDQTDPGRATERAQIR
jgi:excisionase family DNA binding protein